MTIQSQPVSSPYSREAIYGKISDLTYLTELTPLLKEKQIQITPIDSDHCELQAHVMNFSATLTLVISKRIPNQEVRYNIEHEMLPAELSIQLSEVDATHTDLLLTLESSVNPFVAGMIKPHIEEAVEHIATMLGKINYDH